MSSVKEALPKLLENNSERNNSVPQGIAAFKDSYVGINSLAELATSEDRVCVLNILGGESRTVTPISHVYSGGNIVCGTMPGRSGSVMKTKIGDIPVYNNISEALEAGHKFNVAVVYVPPAGVKDSVIEAVRINPDLNKIVILTEKISLHSSRIIRQFCQLRGIDVFGGNCLGLGDALNHVRIGGALGGNAPEESMVPGSIAIYSNSGNFTTTIATYLQTAGWGTSVSFSSGKDIYIHFAAEEFTNAFHNDERSKAAIMYIEPGGYYERDLEFEKPVVCCIVGRWKSNMTGACGHAGAIAGAGDNAIEKEKWFMKKFGVKSIFTPDNPECTKKGALVTNIAHIPEAMSAVMKKNSVEPDFEPKGDLSLKCWLASSNDVGLPKELDVQPEEAIAPYNEQIENLSKQIGAVLPRQAMKDTSGASMMDPKTQVSRLNGTSVLDCSTRTFEENLVMALTREYPDSNGRELANVVLNAFVNQNGTPQLAAAQAAREAENSPNTVLSSSLAILGPKSALPARKAVDAFVELFGYAKIKDVSNESFDVSSQLSKAQKDELDKIFLSEKESPRAKQMEKALKSRNVKSIFISFLQELAKKTGTFVNEDSLLAAASCHLAWMPLMKKGLTLTTLRNIPWHLQIYSAMIGCSVESSEQTKEAFRGVDNQELMDSWSFTETAYLAQIGQRPKANELLDFSILLGLVSTNGPGTITAQGAKGAVSADGSEVSERVQINKAYVGFLTHAGYAHGGNGYEAMEFLINQFRKTNLDNPDNAKHNLDLEAMAMDYAKEYKIYKTDAKAKGNLSYAKIPCVNHPVFKGEDVNYDPREVFVKDLFAEKKSYNIFLEFYHELVNALYKTGVSRNVYCVNIDAVIATILLKMLWRPFMEGSFSEKALETAAFSVFLYARMIGSAAEIEDHINRGRNMDTRTAASKCKFVGQI
ncbi:MAG: CoA-binding protein [Alphaproteobacteria bacterium]|nr:CoA-binding protein [Alphaproteobacteria bacterium]